MKQLNELVGISDMLLFLNSSYDSCNFAIIIILSYFHFGKNCYSTSEMHTKKSHYTPFVEFNNNKPYVNIIFCYNAQLCLYAH